ncbi:acetyl-CoA carboxylase, carboxyltransferase subunit beta [Sneathiella chinensis]|uniref:Acetyl-coenzyme A carboxylase carboxyl transferase subunit beta n=1 Tax=Sneathiella chinensis TaxID=349750 RepID=A0ABQ5TYE3_9PROT|nr:acetyl-CoA carboxylase, carboxyltransferase subunit beta [Sneathiella chinensis]GLQ04967.1 acetyl-coenzyme A carboxylase carboxyl transferase subunit beta [Sneathiella chinensis]
MNWLTNKVLPKIRKLTTSSRDTPDNLWVKCPGCGEMLFHQELVQNLNVCNHCDHHLRVGPKDRFEQLFDGSRYDVIELPDVQVDPLKFRDSRKYTDRLKDARHNTGDKDAMIVAHGKMGGNAAVVAVQNFQFMGGSLGMAVGEAIVAASKLAILQKAPLILFSAAGGARMQEGILSLMQMPRTTVAVQRLKEAKLPFIVVLTDPTTGGVTASYAMLGDIQISEPGTLICFAGPRVIEETIREKLPEGFQRAEFLVEKGMLDMVVHRRDMKKTLSVLIDLIANKFKSEDTADKSAPAAEPTQDAAPAADAAGKKADAPSESKA